MTLISGRHLFSDSRSRFIQMQRRESCLSKVMHNYRAGAGRAAECSGCSEQEGAGVTELSVSFTLCLFISL